MATDGEKADLTRRFKEALRVRVQHLQAIYDTAAAHDEALAQARLLAGEFGKPAPSAKRLARIVKEVLAGFAPFERTLRPNGAYPQWVRDVAGSSRSRHAKLQRESVVPPDVEPVTVDDVWNLAVMSDFRCAVSGVALGHDHANLGAVVRFPFAPTLDQIEPGRGYAKGNVRLVCNMANFAKNQWSDAALEAFVDGYAAKRGAAAQR